MEYPSTVTGIPVSSPVSIFGVGTPSHVQIMFSPPFIISCKLQKKGKLVPIFMSTFQTVFVRANGIALIAFTESLNELAFTFTFLAFVVHETPVTHQ